MINIDRSQPAPISLEVEKGKKSGTYRTKDVYDRLASDFFEKCYLCEDKGIEPEIEHFVACQGDRDLEFSWRNLFYACRHCNGTKAITGNILDCTDRNHKILDWLKFELNDDGSVMVTPLEDTEPVINTANLLNKIYKGHTFAKLLGAKGIRNRIEKELAEFDEILKQNRIDLVEYRLRKESAFVAFKVWFIRINEEYNNQYKQYITT